MNNIYLHKWVHFGNCYPLPEVEKICNPLLKGKNFIEFLRNLECKVTYGTFAGDPWEDSTYLVLSKDQALGICTEVVVCVTKEGLNTIIDKALKDYCKRRAQFFEKF